MKLNFRNLFNFSLIFELFFFAFTLLLAIGVALNLAMKSAAEKVISENKLSAWQFIIAFIIATIILILILKFFKRPWVIKGLFYLAIFEGLWLFSQAYFKWPDFLTVLAAIFLFWAVYRNVLIHDLVIVLAISAISVIFGLNFTPSVIIIILLILTCYDFLAVYKTKHMVEMFRKLTEAKVYFSLIIPFNFSGMFKKTKEVSPDSEFMFLGTGDLALPAIFVVSALKISLKTSLITALGAIGGLILLYLIFITQKERQPMPGLPPIVLGSLVGFLISFLF